MSFTNVEDEEKFEYYSNLLDNMYQTWVDDNVKTNSYTEILKKALENFDLTEKCDYDDFDDAKKKIQIQMSEIKMNITSVKGIEMYIEEFREKYNKLATNINDAGNMISFMLKYHFTYNDNNVKINDTLIDLFSVNNSGANYNVFQKLKLYFQTLLRRNGLKKYIIGGECYCFKKKMIGGIYTNSWVKFKKLSDFIEEEVDYNNNEDLWALASKSSGTIETIIKHFSEHKISDFPEVVKDRHIFSFSTGVYTTKNVREEIIDGKPKKIYYDKYYPYDSDEKVDFPAASCVYIDKEFHPYDYENWFDIVKNHCPNFKYIMDYQKWPEEVQEWLCILIGRMVYYVGELDDWQVFPFLLGSAGTGKSTILENIVKFFYEEEDVGVLSNNIERLFGLSSLVDKKIFIAPEIKEDCRLEQAEFQSMVSGEEININVKFETAKKRKFTVPGIAAGNVLFNFNDNSNSISRRLMVFLLERRPESDVVDTTLRYKLQEEMPSVLQACVKGYLNKINTCGSSGIWKIIPKYFSATKDDVKKSSDPLTAFFEHSKANSVLRFGSDLYMPETRLKDLARKYITENFNKRITWVKSFYSNTFNDYGLKLITNERRIYPIEKGSLLSETFVLGVDVISEENTGVNQSTGDINL